MEFPFHSLRNSSVESRKPSDFAGCPHRCSIADRMRCRLTAHHPSCTSVGLGRKRSPAICSIQLPNCSKNGSRLCHPLVEINTRQMKGIRKTANRTKVAELDWRDSPRERPIYPQRHLHGKSSPDGDMA